MNEEDNNLEKRDDKAPLMDHSYDGIQELDNDLPAWWQGIFYCSIIFGLVYWLAYHLAGSGNLMEDEYKQAVREHQMILDAAEMDFDSLPEERKLIVRIENGKKIFALKCATCHRADGGGSVGPNLTDAAFLHGGKLEDMLKVVTKGVPGTAMLAQDMSPEELLSVATYIHSIAGTNVANGKEAQGKEEK